MFYSPTFLNKEQRYAVFHLILYQIKLANELLIKAFGKFLIENETTYLVGHIQNVNNLAMFSPFFIYYKYTINKYFIIFIQHFILNVIKAKYKRRLKVKYHPF